MAWLTVTIPPPLLPLRADHVIEWSWARGSPSQHEN